MSDYIENLTNIFTDYNDLIKRAEVKNRPGLKHEFKKINREGVKHEVEKINMSAMHIFSQKFKSGKQQELPPEIQRRINEIEATREEDFDNISDTDKNTLHAIQSRIKRLESRLRKSGPEDESSTGPPLKIHVRSPEEAIAKKELVTHLKQKRNLRGEERVQKRQKELEVIQTLRTNYCLPSKGDYSQNTDEAIHTLQEIRKGGRSKAFVLVSDSDEENETHFTIYVLEKDEVKAGKILIENDGKCIVNFDANEKEFNSFDEMKKKLGLNAFATSVLHSIETEKEIMAGIDITAGSTALHTAYKMGDKSLIEKLLKNGADLDVRDSDGNTVLMSALYDEKEEFAKLFINPYVVKIPNRDGLTPLHIACSKGFKDVVKLLLDNGSNINDRSLLNGNTALMDAIFNHKMECVQVLLKRAANSNILTDFINTPNEEGATPLIIATIRQETELVGFLLEHGANIEDKDAAGNNAFMHAIMHANPTIVEKIIIEADKKKLNIINAPNGDGETPLHLACRYGINYLIGPLMERGASLAAKDIYGDTPLKTAIKNGKTEIVKFLIAIGVRLDVLNEKDKSGYTPLQSAIIQDGMSEMARLLIETGIGLDVKDSNEFTLLHLAIKHDRPEIAELLIEKRADLNVKNNFGYTPLQLAIVMGKTEIATLLIKTGVGLNVRDEFGDSLLHLAIKNDRPEIAMILIETRTGLDVRDIYGYTPLQLAIEMGRTEIAQFIIGTGLVKEGIFLKSSVGKTVAPHEVSDTEKSSLVETRTPRLYKSTESVEQTIKAGAIKELDVLGLFVENESEENVKRRMMVFAKTMDISVPLIAFSQTNQGKITLHLLEKYDKEPRSIILDVKTNGYYNAETGKILARSTKELVKGSISLKRAEANQELLYTKALENAKAKGLLVEEITESTIEDRMNALTEKLSTGTNIVAITKGPGRNQLALHFLTADSEYNSIEYEVGVDGYYKIIKRAVGTSAVNVAETFDRLMEKELYNFPKFISLSEVEKQLKQLEQDISSYVFESEKELTDAFRRLSTEDKAKKMFGVFKDGDNYKIATRWSNEKGLETKTLKIVTDGYVIEGQKETIPNASDLKNIFGVSVQEEIEKVKKLEHDIGSYVFASEKELVDAFRRLSAEDKAKKMFGVFKDGDNYKIATRWSSEKGLETKTLKIATEGYVIEGRNETLPNVNNLKEIFGISIQEEIEKVKKLEHDISSYVFANEKELTDVFRRLSAEDKAKKMFGVFKDGDIYKIATRWSSEKGLETKTLKIATEGYVIEGQNETIPNVNDLKNLFGTSVQEEIEKVKKLERDISSYVFANEKELTNAFRTLSAQDLAKKKMFGVFKDGDNYKIATRWSSEKGLETKILKIVTEGYVIEGQNETIPNVNDLKNLYGTSVGKVLKNYFQKEKDAEKEYTHAIKLLHDKKLLIEDKDENTIKTQMQDLAIKLKGQKLESIISVCTVNKDKKEITFHRIKTIGEAEVVYAPLKFSVKSGGYYQALEGNSTYQNFSELFTAVYSDFNVVSLTEFAKKQSGGTDTDELLELVSKSNSNKFEQYKAPIKLFIIAYLEFKKSRGSFDSNMAAKARQILDNAFPDIAKLNAVEQKKKLSREFKQISLCMHPDKFENITENETKEITEFYKFVSSCFEQTK